jgi:hypothetical protein
MVWRGLTGGLLGLGEGGGAPEMTNRAVNRLWPITSIANITAIANVVASDKSGNTNAIVGIPRETD